MVRAYVLLTGDIGAEKDIISQLKAIENVKEVHGTLGLYDIILKIEADTEDQVNKTITSKIRNMNRVHSTITLMRVEGGDEITQGADKLMGSILGKNKTQAYVILHTDKGQEFFVLRNLMRIPEVKEGDVIFGHYDVIGKIEAESHKDLERITTKFVRNLQNVRTSMTLNVISEQD